ncbi:MAG: FAD-dependent oxidoreductase [Acidobacteria bacterium]|nr:FAD-dependent oxidoreductase [Acidobacteriota bacterium]
MKTYDIVTIGGGPAGITIAKNLGKAKKVAIIRPEEYSMIYCAMPYVIENEIPLEKSFKSDSLVTGSGADLIRSAVTRVDFDNKTVTTADGESYGYQKLIIATGADPILPPIPGIETKGVFVFKTGKHLCDIKEIIDRHTIEYAVVIGAGAIGIEVAQALNKVTKECHLVDMTPHVLPNLVEGDMIGPVEETLTESGVKLHLNAKVEKLEGKEWVSGVVLDTGQKISFGDSGNTGEGPRGIVVFSVGMRARTELFTDTALAIGKQGIIVNDKMETNIKDVYAVGDCVQFVSGITGEVVPGKLATNAVPMARMLAKNFIGDKRHYPGFFNGAATKVENLYVGGTGLKESEAQGKFDIITATAELTTIFPILPNSKKLKMKLIADRKTKRILGAQMVSGSPVIDKLNTVTLAIQHKLTADHLVQLSYAAQPYQSFYPANNIIVACAEKILDKLRN